MKRLIIAIGLLALLTQCSSPKNTITLAGSTAFLPYAERLAEVYSEKHPEIRINVQGGGSSVGIQAAMQGTVDIGMADLVELPDYAKTVLKSIVVARDGIAIIVHPSNKIFNLTSLQVMNIFSGKIQYWNEIGGAKKKINIISREDGSGTRKSFQVLIMHNKELPGDAMIQNSNGTIREAVATDPDSIGYISIGSLDERVKTVFLDGVTPNKKNMLAGKYKLKRPIFFLLKGKPKPITKRFINFVLSNEAQQIISTEGLISAK